MPRRKGAHTGGHEKQSRTLALRAPWIQHAWLEQVQTQHEMAARQPEIPRLTSRWPHAPCRGAAECKSVVANVLPHLENQLAPEMPRLAQAVRVGGLRQLVELDLGRLDGAGDIQFGDALHGLARARHWRPQPGHVATLRLWRLGARRNEGGAAAGLEHGIGFLRDLAADRFEYGVAALHDFGEILRGV